MSSDDISSPLNGERMQAPDGSPVLGALIAIGIELVLAVVVLALWALLH